ncbi:hypothetical protein [Streptomyces naphthomycinicus]|uniref:hypothetical protein n=1 Tax=Streptomyces naphthomycinicus TaxID=2872625 RepID=UPI001CEC788C|nr:hypothetical protein [Streptomyces sp. TML10]
MTHSEVRLHRDDVKLDGAKLCGARFVPTTSVRCPESIAVYRVDSARGAWGDVFPCSQADRERWDAAVRNCLDALSRALEALYRAHGGRSCRIDLYKSSWYWVHITEPRRWPRWQRRLREQSEQAQLAFAAAVQQAEEAYRPVREEIAELLAEYKAEQEAAERARRQEREAAELARRQEREAARLARRREARRKRSVLRRVATAQVWLFEVGEAGSPVSVHRADVPASSIELPGPSTGSSAEEGLTPRRLEESLLTLVRESGYTAEIRWDEAAQAEVERECRALGAAASFPEWWHAVTKGAWRDTRHGPQAVPPPPPASDTPLRPSIGGSGMSGTGGYTAGHGFGGFGGY